MESYSFFNLMLFYYMYFSFRQSLSTSSQTAYSRLFGYSLATTSLPIWIYDKRLIFRYDKKIPDYFSVAGAPWQFTYDWFDSFARRSISALTISFHGARSSNSSSLILSLSCWFAQRNNLIMPVDRLDYADFLKTLYGIF